MIDPFIYVDDLEREPWVLGSHDSPAAFLNRVLQTTGAARMDHILVQSHASASACTLEHTHSPAMTKDISYKEGQE